MWPNWRSATWVMLLFCPNPSTRYHPNKKLPASQLGAISTLGSAKMRSPPVAQPRSPHPEKTPNQGIQIRPGGSRAMKPRKGAGAHGRRPRGYQTAITAKAAPRSRGTPSGSRRRACPPKIRSLGHRAPGSRRCPERPHCGWHSHQTGRSATLTRKETRPSPERRSKAGASLSTFCQQDRTALAL